MFNYFSELFNQIKKFTGLNKDIGFVTIGDIGGGIIFATLWLILARTMTVSEYGQINYLIAIAAISSGVAVFGINNTMITHLPKGNKELRNQINSFILIISITAAIIILIISESFSIFILTMSIVFLIMSLSETLGNKKYKEYALINLGTRALQFILILTFYYFWGIDFALFGFSLGMLLFSYKYFSSLKYFRIKFTEIFSRYKFILHSYSLQMSKNSMFADKLLIGPLFGFVLLGQYQLGIQFLLFLAIVPQILFVYLLPQNATGFSHTKIKYFGVIASVGLALILLVMMPLIVNTVFPKYSESIMAYQITIFAVIPLSISAVISPKLFASEQSKHIFYGVLAFLSIQFSSIVTLGTIYGINGLAISIVLGTSFQALYLIIANRFFIKKVKA